MVQLCGTPKLLKGSDYFQDLLQKIPKATQRIVIHTMCILWDEYTIRLLPLLEDAVKRGVKVTILGDAFSMVEGILTKAPANQTFRNTWRYTQHKNTQLAAQGIHIAYIGSLGATPFKNRCHSKITIVDNKVYTFGGVNFLEAGFTASDYMFAYDDPSNAAFADMLELLVTDIELRRLPAHDIRQAINDTDMLLYDVGTPGQSVIYDKACELTQASRRVYYVSQMYPSGKLASLLKHAPAECYFNRQRNFMSLSSLHHMPSLAIDNVRHSLRTRYRRSEFLHAKFMLFELHDGTKVSLAGSNNFNWRGAAYGTKEIALLSKDEAIWDQLYAFMDTTVRVQS